MEVRGEMADTPSAAICQKSTDAALARSASAWTAVLGCIDIYTWRQGKNLVSWVHAAESI